MEVQTITLLPRSSQFPLYINYPTIHRCTIEKIKVNYILYTNLLSWDLYYIYFWMYCLATLMVIGCILRLSNEFKFSFLYLINVYLKVTHFIFSLVRLHIIFFYFFIFYVNKLFNDLSIYIFLLIINKQYLI